MIVQALYPPALWFCLINLCLWICVDSFTIRIWIIPQHRIQQVTFPPKALFLPWSVTIANGGHILHWENQISISFHIESDMIVVTIFLSILKQMEFHLVLNWNENYHHDHIPFNLNGNRNLFPRVHETPRNKRAMFQYPRRETHFWFLLNQLDSECIYLFPIDLETTRILFGSNSIRKCQIQCDFG